jgi:hypothetical protein
MWALAHAILAPSRHDRQQLVGRATTVRMFSRFGCGGDPAPSPRRWSLSAERSAS